MEPLFTSRKEGSEYKNFNQKLTKALKKRLNKIVETGEEAKDSIFSFEAV